MPLAAGGEGTAGPGERRGPGQRLLRQEADSSSRLSMKRTEARPLSHSFRGFVFSSCTFLSSQEFEGQVEKVLEDLR